MELTIHVHHHFDPGPGGEEVLHILRALQGKIDTMATDLTRITASVAAVKDRDDSIIALVNSLAQQLRDNATDPAAINALADSLDADNQSVVDAVNANTPAAPAP